MKNKIDVFLKNLFKKRQKGPKEGIVESHIEKLSKKIRSSGNYDLNLQLLKNPPAAPDKEYYKKIEGSEYYVSNFGTILSCYKDKKKFLSNKFSHNRLFIDNKYYTITRSNLVYELFNNEKLKSKSIISLFDKDRGIDSNNLFQENFGDILRRRNTQRNQKRGVYKWSDKNGYSKWRAIIKIKNKVTTIGYYNKREDAENAYHSAFTKIFGYEPYKKD